MSRRNRAVELSRTNYTGMPGDKVLELYPTDYLDCRSVQHEWPTRKDSGAMTFRYVGRGLIDCTMSCKRCGYTKTLHFNNRFERVEKDSTSYPPGYLTSKTGLTKADFRSHNYSGLFQDANNHGLVEAYDEGER